jgi:SAM-dependent methyltransferase
MRERVKNGEETKVREAVRERYGDIAKRVAAGERGSCGCGSCDPSGDPVTRDLYTTGETSALPEAAVLASLGCGNPTALAELSSGEVVLDLGSGGGIDVLLSARRVGPGGRAYGLDMTDEMLALARENQRKAGVENAEFLKGTIEEIPLPDASVDVVISNCVINLSTDKGRVLREAFRVLRPGGRFAVSDIVVRRELTPEIRRSLELWAGCVAGALTERDYTRLLESAGFTDVTLTPTREFGAADTREMASACCGSAPAGDLAALEGALVSAFVRARKPGA